MPKYAAFIRGIMLGRQGVERTLLLDSFARAGAVSPRSHLATGNVTFEADDTVAARIATAVEADLVTMTGTTKDVFIRSADELRALTRVSPFADWPLASEAHELAVMFLSGPFELPFNLPSVSERGDTTYLSRTDREVFIGTHLVNGRPGNPGGWLERRLKAPITVRNWNTVMRVLRHLESI